VAWDDGHERLFSLEGSVNGCGAALDSVGRKLGFDVAAIHEHAAHWLTGETPLLFLNGVSGLGSPYWLADFPTQFIGSGTVEQKMQAVLESVLFLLQVNLEEMERQLGRPRRLQVSGGLATVRPLCQRLADLSGLEVERSEQPEATALGLAFLLAGQPSVWSPSMSFEGFLPRANDRLLSRYRRWRRELDIRCRS
jgi:glycerol kinase